MDSSRVTFTEDELIPLSLLSQFYYCPRRAGLIMLERQWQDNVHTAEGTLLHERVHSGLHESRGDVRLLRGVHLRSLELGVAGMADCVELTQAEGGASIPRLPGTWSVTPVEYKHGVVREELEYEVQLCAQAMCLEEMWSCHIGNGYIYYGADRRRKHVALTENLRGLVTAGCNGLHNMLSSCTLPMPTKKKKCRECSMQEICLPLHSRRSTDYVARLLEFAQGGSEDEEDS